MRQRIDAATEYRGDALVIRQDWRPPCPSTEDGRRSLAAAIRSYERHLATATPKEIAGRVTTLLAHNFVPDMPYKAQAALVGDWIDVLAGYPFWAIQNAALTWLAHREPAERANVTRIRELCERLVSRPRCELAVLRRMQCAQPFALGTPVTGYAALSPEKRAEIDAIVRETYAHLKGGDMERIAG